MMGVRMPLNSVLTALWAPTLFPLAPSMLDDKTLQANLQKPTYNAASNIWGKPVSGKNKPTYRVPAGGALVAQPGKQSASSTKNLNHMLAPPLDSSSQPLVTSSTCCEIQVPDTLLDFFECDQGKIKTANGQRRSKLFWMFTCSYGRAERSCLDRAEVMKPLQPGEYAQVLIVRKEQRELYSRRFGGSYIIATLPEEMTVKYAELSEALTLDVTSGIGYARLFSQLLAHSLGLKHIWVRRHLCYSKSSYRYLESKTLSSHLCVLSLADAR